MKKTIVKIVLGMFVLTSCTTKEGNKIESDTVKDTITESTTTKNKASELEISKDFLALVPIDLLDAKSTNVYEKYGIEFSGNCYACDLADFSFSKNKIIWKNVCDEMDIFKITDVVFSVEENKTILKTSEHTFTFIKIEEAPVYELTIEGQKLDVSNKRIAKYFTTKQALPLFSEHDCGDFEG